MKRSGDKWEAAYMDTASRFAELSTARKLKVGACVVKDNRIISIGYNGMPSGWDNDCEQCCDGGGSAYSLGCYHDHCTGPKTKDEVIHAEANAITKLAKSNESGEGAHMYCTHAPCIHCAKLVAGSGISRLYYKEAYRLDDGLKFLEKSGVELVQL